MKQLAWTVLFVGGNFAYAQEKATQHVQQTWIAYFNQMRISDRWGTWFDGHLRTLDGFTDDLSTLILRAGITYHANDRLRFTAGYGFINFFPAGNHPGISQPEHRPWQQVAWTRAGKRSRLSNNLRLEERYRRKIKDEDELASGYNFNYRLRHNVSLMLPLAKNAFAPNTFSVAMNNEVHVNFGKQIVYNYFDQNRFLAGFAYHVNATDYLQFGYMNVFQQLAPGNEYRMTHAARAYYYHNIDLRKQRKTAN